MSASLVCSRSVLLICQRQINKATCRWGLIHTAKATSKANPLSLARALSLSRTSLSLSLSLARAHALSLSLSLSRTQLLLRLTQHLVKGHVLNMICIKYDLRHTSPKANPRSLSLALFRSLARGRARALSISISLPTSPKANPTSFKASPTSPIHYCISMQPRARFS